MKLSVGYQYNEDRPFADVIRDYAPHIESVYFPWIDTASGRSKLSGFDGYFDYNLQEALVRDLEEIKGLGIGLNLLFNANCYGADAMSKNLEGRVCSIEALERGQSVEITLAGGVAHAEVSSVEKR